MKMFLLSISIVVLSLMLINKKVKDIIEDLWEDKKHLLIIGIISAQDKFEARQTIRLTWRNLMRNDNVVYYFLIGKNICEIHPEDRVDEYSCKEWEIRFPKGVNDSVQYSSNKIDCRGESIQTQVPLGFTFITHHSLIVRRLSILKDLVIQLNQVRVSLRSSTGEKLASVTFTADEIEINSNSSIISKSAQAYVLPKGFEGEVRVEMTELPKLNLDCRFHFSDSIGAIRILHLIENLHERPHNVLNDSFAPVAVLYTLQDIVEHKDFVKRKPQRQRLWKEQTAILKFKLEEESQEKGDIIFLDVVDIYRNLPEKVLQFFQWAHKNQRFSYLLKTDDDCFIDVLSVEKELIKVENSRAQFHGKSKHIWWWSSFREYWPVQTFGKWREDAYNAMLYPPFPCGAGYVLSYDVVSFLARNSDVLYCGFQGEDVSVGIWLSALNPIRHHESNNSCHWSCDKSHHHLHSCNRAQLAGAAMMVAWTEYQERLHTLESDNG